MSKSFILIEVLIATLIAVISIMALLNLNTNGFNLLNKLKKQENSIGVFSIVLLNANKDFNKKTILLKRFVEKDFSFDDRERSFLNQKQVHYFQNEIKKIDLDKDTGITIHIDEVIANGFKGYTFLKENK